MDVDADGSQELLATADEGLSILHRDRRLTLLHASHPLDVAWTHEDQSGLELLVLSETSGELSIEQLVCTETAEPSCEVLLQVRVDHVATEILVGDFDEDGRNDLVLGGVRNVSVLRGFASDDGSPRRGTTEDVGVVEGFDAESHARMLAADLDSDGHLDIASLDLEVGVKAFFGAGDGSFVEAGLADSSLADAYRLHAADLGGDGSIELIVMGWSNTWVLEKQGRRSFERSSGLDTALGRTAPASLLGDFDEAPGMELLLVEDFVDFASVASYSDASSQWVVRELSSLPDGPTSYIHWATAWDVDADGFDEAVSLLGTPIYCE
ncbi:MAG: VCBS repeat-containing protein [Deltaproteobacteria bacterium]|nr:VCBS repeat-containing protein [Nannocystaceae bacterium]